LRTALLDLLFELGEPAHALILAGGYGLFLKQVQLLSDDVRTLLARDLWPEARSTGDLDVFLPAEFLADAATFDEIRPVRNGDARRSGHAGWQEELVLFECPSS
jgi:hypothetical protein